MKSAGRHNFCRALVMFTVVSCIALVRSASAQCEPEKPADDDKPAKTKGAVALRYDWQPNTNYMYEVTIDAQLPDRKLTYKGMSTLRVRDVSNGQCTLVQSGALQKNEQMKPQARANTPGLPPGFPHHFSHAGRHMHGLPGRMVREPAHELTIDDRGTLLKMQGNNSLPLLLGDLATFMIEPLPEKRERAWRVENGLAVMEKKSTPTSRLPHRSRLTPTETSVTTRPGGELLTYRVKGVKNNKVTIAKQMRLQTADQSEGNASYEQEGSGELVFDQKRGVMAEAEFKLVNTYNQDNISIKVPVEVHYRLLDEKEVAKMAEEGKARLEKMQEERAKADEDASQPLSDQEARELIAALKDRQTRNKAADTLSKKKVPDGHQEAIAKALDDLLASDDNGARDAATKALKIWATSENVPTLVNLLKNEDNIFVRARAMEILGQLQDKRGAEAVAAMFLISRGDARKSLEQMGPVAEPYVLPLLETPDEGARADVCRILAAIGTSKSRAKLERLALKPRGSDAQAAREALAKIESR